MENAKVAIIVSTYNGEKYIAEQLESLLNQTYNNIDIYIRDDGSKDGTTDIIEKYAVENSNIKLFKCENVGLVNSFYKCLEEAFKEADYFAYCDQDDKWHENKIEEAVNAVQKVETDKPLLYFTEFNYCDETLNFQSTSKMNRKGYSFRNSLVECISSGNTMLFDKNIAEAILQSKTEAVCLHDWWMYMIATSMGEIVYTPEPSLEYRRTGNNVTPGGGGFLKLQLFRIKKFLFGDYFKNIRKQIKRFSECFYNDLSAEDKKLLDLFNSDRYSIKKQMKKVFYPKMFRQRALDEILVRCMFLIGKI